MPLRCSLTCAATRHLQMTRLKAKKSGVSILYCGQTPISFAIPLSPPSIVMAAAKQAPRQRSAGYCISSPTLLAQPPKHHHPTRLLPGQLQFHRRAIIVQAAAGDGVSAPLDHSDCAGDRVHHHMRRLRETEMYHLKKCQLARRQHRPA